MAAGSFLVDIRDNDFVPQGKALGTTAQAIPPQTLTSTVTGGVIDCLTADGVINALLTIGAVSGTGGPSNYVTFQESTLTNSAFTAVADTRSTFTTATTSNTRQWTFFVRTKRYLQCVATISGTTSPSFATAVEVVGQSKIVNAAGAGYISVSTAP